MHVLTSSITRVLRSKSRDASPKTTTHRRAWRDGSTGVYTCLVHGRFTASQRPGRDRQLKQRFLTSFICQRLDTRLYVESVSYLVMFFSHNKSMKSRLLNICRRRARRRTPTRPPPLAFAPPARLPLLAGAPPARPLLLACAPPARPPLLACAPPLHLLAHARVAVRDPRGRRACGSSATAARIWPVALRPASLSHVCAVPHRRLAARHHVRLNVSTGAAPYRTCTQVVRRFARMVNQDEVLSLTEDLSWHI